MEFSQKIKIIFKLNLDNLVRFAFHMSQAFTFIIVKLLADYPALYVLLPHCYYLGLCCHLKAQHWEDIFSL